MSGWRRLRGHSGRRLGVLLRLLLTLRRPIAQRRLRAELVTRLRFGSGHFQGSTYTRENRFPVLFEACRKLLSGCSAPRVLSFGCSTGEEVFTLGRYLPAAEITGVDLNRWCLAEAQRRTSAAARVRFVHARAAEFAESGGYDAIFALAVFQRTENAAAGATKGFCFATFAQSVAMLDDKLKPGGFLFLDHCDFAFQSTPTAARYEALCFPGSERVRHRALFGLDDVRESTVYSLPRVYRKLV